MADEMAGVRALLAQEKPTSGSFAERRERWVRSFNIFSPVPAGTMVQPVAQGGPQGEWVSALGVGAADRTRVLLYFHGGGFTAGSAAAYRGLSTRLSAATGRPVLAADYRLAPEHPFPAALDDCVAAYRWLVGAGGCLPRDVVIVGDSAGGNLMMATLLSLRDAGDALPAAGIGLSAQFDLALSGASVVERAARDPLILPELLRRCAAAYAGDTDPRDPRASPLYAEMAGLPPLLLHVGSEEMLRDDSVRLAAKAKAAGIDVTLEEWPGMIHVWHLFSDRLTDARLALDRVGAFVREHT